MTVSSKESMSREDRELEGRRVTMSCSQCDWQRQFTNDPRTSNMMNREFDEHEAEAHPHGAFYRMIFNG